MHFNHVFNCSYRDPPVSALMKAKSPTILANKPIIIQEEMGNISIDFLPEWRYSKTSYILMIKPNCSFRVGVPHKKEKVKRTSNLKNKKTRLIQIKI